jgi:GNAT superfamily N-acetyltransferase
MTTTVRKVELADKDRWLELFKAYIVFYESQLTPEQFELTWQRIHSDFNMYGLVAEQNGRIIGIAHYLYRPSTWAVQDFCYLEDLFVDPAARGTGAGRALIKALEEIARLAGSERLYWTTAPDNATARRLYDSLATTNRVQYRIPIEQSK